MSMLQLVVICFWAIPFQTLKQQAMATTTAAKLLDILDDNHRRRLFDVSLCVTYEDRPGGAFFVLPGSIPGLIHAWEACHLQVSGCITPKQRAAFVVCVTPLVTAKLGVVDVKQLFHEVILRFKAAVRNAMQQVTKNTRSWILATCNGADPRQMVYNELPASSVDFLSISSTNRLTQV
jgi:hypothetical protein